MMDRRSLLKGLFAISVAPKLEVFTGVTSGFDARVNEHLNIWSRELKEALLNELFPMKFTEMNDDP